MSEVISYFKDRYNEEVARFSHMETKCASFLRFLTVVIGSLGAVAAFKSEAIFSPTSELGWVKLILYIIAVFLLICSWGHALVSLKIGECPTAPRTKPVKDYLETVDEKKVKSYIIQCYLDTTTALDEVINKKSKYLKMSYQELTTAAWFIGALSIVTVYQEVFK